MLQNSSSLQAFAASKKAGIVASVLVPSNTLGELQHSDSKVKRPNIHQKLGEQEDYVKKILGKQTNSNVRGSQSTYGPSYGQSRIGFGAQSSHSGGKSNTTTGGGIASRFSLALSRVIDNTAATAEINEGQDEDDIQEMVNLI